MENQKFSRFFGFNYKNIFLSTDLLANFRVLVNPIAIALNLECRYWREDLILLYDPRDGFNARMIARRVRAFFK